MRINSIESNNFKGYDARPLKGFFMGTNSGGIASEMKQIGQKEGFKIYSRIRSKNGSFFREAIPKLSPFGLIRDIWAQDIITFGKDKLLAFANRYDTFAICDFFNIKYQETPRHISGGNFFIVDNDEKEDLFIGEKEFKDFSPKQLKELYNVDKIHIIPQMDFHLDLFIRPLDKKRILIADDEMTIKILNEGLEKFKHYAKSKKIEKHPTTNAIIEKFNELICKFKLDISINKNPKTDEVIRIIKNAGFTPIRVPGRIYTTNFRNDNECFLSHDCNYMNANVIKKNNGDLVYITNKSNIDKILGLETDFTNDFDFRFEKEFVKTISPYINPDKIYFVDGEDNFISTKMLKEMMGGIHCTCAEIPQNIGR